RVLRAGFVVTIDYGFEAQEYYAGHRTDGTLQAYREQRRSSSILEDAGHRDITAHVNFTALIEAGKKFGLELESFTTQERFLMGALQSTPPAELERLDDASKRQLRTLTHPEMLGSVFKVLVQRKSKESKST
ncbi:MAG: SAM-dependent methyltransferase, partial [Verrucomicrobiae bacterium]|nr:SAM-dependent methyltransferase [Verrucomicrobiae bacterium]